MYLMVVKFVSPFSFEEMGREEVGGEDLHRYVSRIGTEVRDLL